MDMTKTFFADEATIAQRELAKSSHDFDTLMLLGSSTDSITRTGVAINRHTPVVILELLAVDEEWSVRRGVAKNRATPRALLLLLSDDDNSWVKSMALETLLA
ncbi:hypothetical protein [Curtobacterium flaccumfaciens]|uniref:hypothetical protein n=1 Tax=Curtobacterium flaccumfaciens TaxID=2035 RepID=UPI0038798EB2